MNKVLVEEPARSQICLADIDQPRFMHSNLEYMQSTRMEQIIAEINRKQNQSSSTQSLVTKILLEKDEEKRIEVILKYVSATMASLAEMQSMSEADLSTSLYSYGIDSTAALTLKMQFEANLEVSFEVI